MKRFIVVLISFCLFGYPKNAIGFYVPGVAPIDFNENDLVEVKAVKMTSSRTQLPYEYYQSPVHCKPDDGVVYKTENLGEILRGDRIVNTRYDIRMLVNEECKQLCKSTVKLTKEQSRLLNKRIRDAYHVHLLIDNLPCATKFKLLDTQQEQYEHGYRLGYMSKDGQYYLNNNIKLLVKYHREQTTGTYRVVGFEVETSSVDKSQIQTLDSSKCKIDISGTQIQPQIINPTTENEIQMIYSVKWIESDIKWASRWDSYLAMTDAKIHWFSIINSLVVVFFLAGILLMIMIRTLRRDIAKYNRDDEELEEAVEETGWKLVHGDVFRPPKRINLLITFIGSGIQLLSMSFILIVFAMLGMLSPSYRGALVTSACFLYVFMGLISGYFSGRMYKTLRGIQWKKVAFMTSTLYPSVVLGICFILNFFIWGKRSSGAVPFSTMIALLAMWLGIALPLVFIGFYFGYRKQSYEHPVRTNQIPRQIPEQQWYMNPFISTLMAGILPFGAMFIELYFIFSAIWENQYYYLFGFLFLVFLIIIISCSQISIVMSYFQLCAEDYNWWWKSFIASGGSALYIFAYSIFYFISELDITEFVPTLLYFGYTFLIAFTFWIITGTIGFYASYLFIIKIYSAIKID